MRDSYNPSDGKQKLGTILSKQNVALEETAIHQ